ncbi:GTP 3',8-cyclase MoaA [Patescibacteria group bacterium]|nr:GTP 3',8-cyclase MoaA [Patescibacteria group bacterium]
MKVDYLRISVTDRCNFNCIYCRPYERVKILNRAQLLSFEEIIEFIRLTARWGIKRIRLTGGEPLIRKDSLKLVDMISRIKGIKDIALTTNGTRLEKFARDLKKAKLSRVNVSLDSLNRKKFTRITGYDELPKVLRGIKAAKKVGLEPIKINVVVLKGINEEEVNNFVEFSQKNSLPVRFIEYMPINEVGEKKWYISNEAVKKKIKKRWGKLESAFLFGAGPAKYFTFKESSAPIGFISFITHPFCKGCNRLRLTSEGKLRPCLISNFEVDIKNALRGEDKKNQTKKLFDLALKYKIMREKNPEVNFDKTGKFMFQIGG